MLVFLMQTIRTDLSQKSEWYEKQSIIYKDPTRHLPIEDGEERKQVLHALYQCFYSQALKLSKFGFFRRIFDNHEDLKRGSDSPAFIAITDTQSWNHEVIIQRFRAVDIEESEFSKYEYEQRPTKEGLDWNETYDRLSKNGTELSLVNKLIFDSEAMVSSPWKTSRR